MGAATRSLRAPLWLGTLAVNAGGPAVGQFVADLGFSGGHAVVHKDPITMSGVASPAPEAVYQSSRQGTSFTYVLSNLEPGALYQLRLHLAETYWTASGQRVFSIAVNGSAVPLLTNLDVFAAAGGKDIALVKEVTANVDPSGKVTLAFTALKDNALVSGLEALLLNTVPPPPQVSALAINAGGPAVGNFAGDMDFNGGYYIQHTAPIDTSKVSNPAPQAVYQSSRQGASFSYVLPNLVPGAVYRVRLHFAETYWAHRRQRLFNVAINGAPVLSNFDVFAAAGGKNIALVEEYKVAVSSNGMLSVGFTSLRDRALVSAVEVARIQ